MSTCGLLLDSFEYTLTLDSQVFPSYITCEHNITGTSALVRLKEKRAQECLI